MKIYLVGGAVRDMLLGVEPKDRDYVVVGATVEEFLKRYPSAQAVGKSFPVFLLPKGAPDATDCFDHDFSGEYAFARTERKTGAGHTAFEVVADPSVTLEQDLSRRDLTINAMALAVPVMEHHRPLEELVEDPYGGLRDLKAGVLRHVGPAFGEDPLRVYRLARFAARYGFEVAPETLEACRDVPRSELGALSGERVGQELLRALRAPHPRRFFDVLLGAQALEAWFPEVRALIGVPAGSPAHHQEGDTYEHTMLALNEAKVAEMWLPYEQRELLCWATLVHDLGKALTPPEQWPGHPGHDERGVAPAEALADRLHLPNWVKQAGVLACREHMRVHTFLDMRKGKMADLVRAADATRLKAEGLAMVCCADACGKVPVGDSVGAKALGVAAVAARAERGHPIPEGLEGAAIGLHIRNRKGAAVRRALRAAGFIKGGPVQEQPVFVRARFALQATSGFPEGAPQREGYTTDAAHDAACDAYAKEWRREYRCTGCGDDPGCPQHGTRGWRAPK